MPPYLLRRNGRYYLRLTIPLELRRWFDGKRETRKALRTTKESLDVHIAAPPLTPEEREE